MMENVMENRGGKLQMMLQKTIYLFCQTLVQGTRLRECKKPEIWAFILAILASHLLLLELEHPDWDFSGHGWFMILSFPRPSSEERSITITASNNQNLC